jgi:hypothetical protein
VSLIARVASLLAVALLSTEAAAESPELPTSISIGAFGGYAAEAQSIWASNPSAYRWGFGVRAGVSIPKFYMGLAFAHHAGTSVDATGVGNLYKLRLRTTMVGPEVGYDAHFGSHIVLRPYVGAGLLFAYSRTELVGSEYVDDRLLLHVTSGLVTSYRIGNVFFGADLRVVVAPIVEPKEWAPGAFATVGYVF